MSVLGAAAAVAAACGGDSTGTAPDVTVTITVTQLTGPDISDLGAGEQRVQCDISLSASATGTARAIWRDATLLFYVGPARATPFDSTLIPMTEIQSSWGASDIGPGDTQQSGWRIWAATPFG